MKKILKVMPVLLVASFAGTAAAQNETRIPGFFAGIELGMARHTVDVSEAGANYDTETGNSSSPGLYLGYNFNDSWSILAQYTNYGEADLFDTRINVDVEGEIVPVNLAFSTETTGLSVVGQYMTPRFVGHWSFGAKLGLMSWDTDFNVKASAGTVSETTTESDSGIAIYGGIGCAYAMSQKLDVTIGMDWFVNDLDVEIIEGAKTDMQYTRLGLGLKYNW
jgi:hypothetical protein